MFISLMASQLSLRAFVLRRKPFPLSASCVLLSASCFPLSTLTMLQSPAMTPSKTRTHLVVLLLYTLLAVVLWYPLPLHLTTHVPGSETWAFDEYTFVWNLWWFREALLTGQNPLQSDFIFHPLGIDLVLYTYNLFNAAFALPLIPFLGTVLTSNLILIGMSILSGWGTWLLCRWLFARTLPTPAADQHTLLSATAFGAGALYAFGAYRAIYAALGHYDLVSTGFIPLFILFFLKAFWGNPTTPYNWRQWHTWRPAILAGVFMAGALLNEMIFGVFLAMLGLLAMAITWRQATKGWFLRLTAAAMVAAILWAPVGIPVVRTLLSTDFVLTGWGDALKLSADLLSFTSPTALHPLWGPDWVTELRSVQVNAVSPGASRFNDVNTVFVGISTLVLAAVAWWRWRGVVRLWVAGLLGFMLLALGPVLQIAGKYQWSFDNVLGNGGTTAIPLPFILLHYIPIVQGNRAANRFSVVLMLCAALLVGYGLLALGKRLPKRSGAWVAGGVGLLLLIEQLSLPLPLTNAQIPAGYAQIIQDPDDVAVLTLPLGWRNSFGVVGVEDTRVEWYLSAHGKRLLQGNISRAPGYKFDYWAQVPVVRSLITLQNDGEVSAEQQVEDEARALETMALLGVRYVAVHPAIEGRPPYEQNRERSLAYLQEVLPMSLLYEGEDLLLYRVDAPAPTTGTIPFGTPTSDLYQVYGWFGDDQEGGISYNWATQEALMLLPVADPTRAMTVTLTVRPFQTPQTLQPLLFEQPIGDPIPLLPGWNDVTLTLPADSLKGPTARLTLRFSRTDLPMDVIPQLTQIGTTGISFRQPITIKSGGPGLGDLAWMTLGDADISAHRNGTNVTVIDPVTGVVEEIRGFDTTANEFERDALHQFIADIPNGKIVAIALQGAATNFLNLDTVAAFQTVGATTGPTDHAVSYALLGIKGAASGSAIEQQSKEGEVNILFLPDDRALSGAVSEVTWGQ
jgi:hypothetical protein